MGNNCPRISRPPEPNRCLLLPHTPGVEHGRINRRRLLCAGGLGFLGLNLADLLRAETLAGRSAAARTGKSPIKSCILMFYYGGPSHHDTWDMKPNCAVGSARRVQEHRHQRAGRAHFGALAAFGQDHGPRWP